MLHLFASVCVSMCVWERGSECLCVCLCVYGIVSECAYVCVSICVSVCARVLACTYRIKPRVRACMQSV